MAATFPLGALGRMKGGVIDILVIRQILLFSGGGCISVAGDGGLRQWQVCNAIDHKAHVPDSFFAIRYIAL